MKISKAIIPELMYVMFAVGFVLPDFLLSNWRIEDAIVLFVCFCLSLGGIVRYFIDRSE